MTKRIGESGNIFFTLFGAVALVGIIGVATSNLMRGPVGTVMKLNQQAKAESQLQIARKMAALESAQQLTSDCEPDTYLEPLPPDVTGACATLGLTGGGCLPASVGASKNDPWGTRVGYCAWDHGPTIGACDPNLLDGTNAATETVIAVISAGPDRTFQTTCGNDPAYVTSGGDDIVMEWTYDDAVQGAGGLWALKSSDPNTAEILNNRNIEVGGSASFQSSASFARDVAFGAGSYLDLTAGSLLNLPDQTVLAVCNAANDRALRVDLSVGMVLQICQDGVGWVDIGGSGAASSVSGADGDVQFNSGDTLYAIDTFNYDVGANRLRIGGNTAADDTLEVTGTADISGDLQANQIDIVTGGSAAGVGLSFNSAGTLGVYGSGTTVGIAVGGSTRLSATATGVGVTGNFAASGTGSIGGTLGVSGKATISNDLDVTGAFQIDGDISDSNSAVTVNDDLVVNQSLQVGTSFAAQNFELDTIGSGEGMYLYTSGTGTGLALNTSGLNRLTIDGSGNSKFTGDVGIGLAGDPTTGLDVGGLFRLRSDPGVTAGTACTLDGSITYTSGDELLICSNITGNWETIGTSGGGGGGGAGIWQRTTGTILINPTYFNDADNFVVGSLQLDDEGSGNQDERMLFENATGAFRAGVANGTEWDTRGNYSAAFGLNTQATADSTFAVGNNAQARATEAVAMGRDVIVAAGALNSMAFGLGTAAGAEPQVTGTESLGIFMQDQSGVNLAANNTVGIFGGKLMIDPNAAATQVAASGSLTVDVEGDVGAIQFCSEDGTFCFTAQDVATGATGAPGNDREVIFNSAGSLYTNTNFVFTSAGNMGLGTATPRARLHVYRNGVTGAIVIEGDETQTSDLNLLTSGDGVSTVGDATATGWTFSARGNSFATASVQNDLMYYYWNGTSYQQRFLLENDTGNLVLSDTDVVGDTKLDVDGTIKMSYGGETCDANREGAIRFMSSDNSFYVCQALANGWQRIITAGSSGAGIPAGGADREIQFNSGGDLAGLSTFVLTSAGRFGLGTAIPAQTFDVTGTANITGATTLGSSLGVTGQVNFSSGLNVTNATVLSNTLDVTGATTLNNTLDVVGANATSLGGSLGVTGQVDFSSGLNVTNATVLSDVLYVSGAATLASSLDVTGQVNFSSGLNVTNATVLSNTLDVNGATTLNGLLTTTADANLGGLVTFTSSGAVLLPVGNTGQRPVGASNGMIRYNTDNGKYEAYQGGIWQDILTSAVAGGAGAPDRGVQFNSGGDFTADAHFTYTSAGDLIVGSSQINDTGTGTEDSRMFFDVSNSAFRAGSADAAQWDYISAGQYSAAFGQNNIASGTGSFSIGNNNIASGNGSFAGGGSSVASGPGSFAMGWATASGDRSVAMGFGPTASNTGSVALGGNSTASGQYSVAIGASNTASSSWATAIGVGNNASGTSSTALGAFNVASGTNATTLGMYTSAGNYSLSVGLSSGFLANKSRVSGQQSYGIFMGNQDNVDLTSNNTMGLYGGSMIIDPAIPATDVVADTALDVNGTIKMSYGSEACDANRIGAVQYSSGDFYLCQNGTSWQRIIVAGAGGAGLPASGNDREIQFNSGGDLAASSTFVLTSAGRFGLGTATPTQTFDVTGTANISGATTLGSSLGVTGQVNFSSGLNVTNATVLSSTLGVTGATTLDGLLTTTANSNLGGLVSFTSTGAFVTNVGTTAQRPSAVQSGMLRFNSDTNQFEGYNGADWNGFMTGAAGVDRQILFNSAGVVTGNADLVFEAAGNVNIGAGNFYFTSAGRLGIGTTTPTLTGAQPLMVDVEGATGSQYFCDNNGNNCFTAAAVAGGSAPAPGADTQVVYNSGGVLYANSGFVYTSAGRLGLGTATPSATSKVTINTGVTSDSVIEGYMNTNASRGMYVLNTNSGANAQATYEAENDAGSVADFGIGSSGGLAGVYGNRAYAWTGGATSGLSIVAANAASDIRIFTGGDTAADERMRVGATGLITFTSTGAFVTNVGTTAQRPSAVQSGMLRFNSDTNQFEGYNGADWNGFMTGAAGNDREILFNSGGVVTGNANFYYQSTGALNLERIYTGNDVGAQNATFSAITVAPTGNQTVGSNSVAPYHYAGHFYGAIPLTNTNQVNAVAGITGSAENYGTGNVSRLQSVVGWVYNAANANIDNIVGLNTQAVTDNGNITNLYGTQIRSVVNGGTVQNDYGLWVAAGNPGGGTITNRYGIYLDTFSGAATNDYGIYQAGTERNYLGGNLGVGVQYASAALDVAGTIKMAYGGEACDAAREGAIQFNSSTNKYYVCPSAGTWQEITIGGAAASPAPGLDTQVVYNSGGVLYAQSGFVYTSAGFIGLGTANPATEMHVYDAAAAGHITVEGASAGAAALSFITSGDGQSDITQAATNGWSLVGVGDTAGSNQGNLVLRHYNGAAVTTPLIFSSTGLLGVGAATPQTRLDVGGTLKIANGGETCSAAGDGGMVRWNGTLMQYCDGASWQDFASGATASPAAPDRGIQFNSGGAFTADANFSYTSAGRLGIGTSTPGAVLDLAAGTSGVPKFYLWNQGNNKSGMGIDMSGASWETTLFGLSNGTGTVSIGFISSGDGVTYTERMEVRDDGILSLGNSTSGQKLNIYRSNGGNVRHGMGVDMTGDSYETNLFGVSDGSQGHFSFGFLANTDGTTYTEVARLWESGLFYTSGTMQISYSGEACDAAHEGAIRYDNGSSTFSFCASAGSGWQGITLGSGTLAALGDTNITGPVNGEVLYYSGGGWVNNALAINDLSDGVTNYTSGNIYMGLGAGASGTTASFNTILGTWSGAAITSGGSNTVLGYSALNVATTGGHNVAIGRGALAANNAEDNTAVGTYAMLGNTTGAQNVAIGRSALFTNTGGGDNVAIGIQSLAYATGDQNVALGSFAGNTLTSGSSNILIGYQANTPAPTTSNYINIGNMFYGSAGTGELFIGGDGALTLPAGASATRPGTLAGTVAVNGMIRYNSTSDKFEGYQGGSWQDILTSAVAGGAAAPDRGVQFNSGGDFAAATNFVYTSAGDLIVGSSQIQDTGTGTEDSRMFFDVSNSAFRAGLADAGQWDYISAGQYSAAFGQNTIASGSRSFAGGSGSRAAGNWSFAFGSNALAKYNGSVAFNGSATGAGAFTVGGTASHLNAIAMGNNATASGQHAIALGTVANASGIDSVALGYAQTVAGDYSTALGTFVDVQATADYSMGIGLGDSYNVSPWMPAIISGASSLGIFMGNQGNVDLASANTMGLFGGKFVIDPSVPATDTVADTALDVNGTIKIAYEGEACDASREGSIQFTSASNTFYFCANTANGWESVSLGSGTLAALSDTTISGPANGEVLYYSGGGWVNNALAINDLADAATATTENNMFIGHNGGASGPNDLNNLAVGFRALDALNNTAGAFIGDNNTAIGHDTLSDCTTCRQNTALGLAALSKATNADSNTAVGFWAQSELTTGGFNTAIGRRTLENNRTGSDNVAIGAGAGFGVVASSDVSRNIFIGRAAGNAVLTGADNNTIIGYGAAGTLTTGASNIIIGHAVDVPFATASNYINIGGVIYGSANTGELFFGSSGVGGAVRIPVGDNTTRPGTLAGTVAVNGMIRYNSATDKFEGYQAGSWQDMITTNVAASAPDRGVQFNSGGNFAAENHFTYTSAGDLIVGSYQKDDTGTGNEDSRMFFDKTKAAFRAGGAWDTAWDDANVGAYSFAAGQDTIAPTVNSTALGYNTTASGAQSFAVGYQTKAAAGNSTAMGMNTIASGFSSFVAGRYSSAGGLTSLAFGQETLAGGDNSMSIGLGNPAGVGSGLSTVSGTSSLGIFMGDQDAVNLSSANTMGLFGGKFVIDPSIPAVDTVADTALDVNGTIKVAYGGETCNANTEGAIRYDSGSNTFSFCALTANDWEAISLGAGTLAALSDTTISGAAAGEVLYYSGGSWVNNALALTNLSDVDTTGFADGDVLLYSAGAAGWVPGSAGISNSNFTDLADTPSTYTAQAGKFARVNSGETALEFTDQVIESVTGANAPTTFDLNDLGDVTSSGATDAQVLQYDSASGNWVAATLSSSSVSAAGANGQIQYNSNGSFAASSTFVYTSAGRLGLGVASPVAMFEVAGGIKFASSSLTCSTAADEGAMQYGSGGSNIFEVCANSATGWEQLALGGTVAGALGDLSDVTTTGVAGADLLYYSAGAASWVPKAVGFTDLSDTPSTYTGQAGRFAVVNSGETAISFTDSVIENVTGQPAPNAININDLGDVSVGGVTDQQVLQYNSATGNWVAATFAGSGTPAGSSTQLQFNSGGAFAASSNLVYDSANSRLTVGGTTGYWGNLQLEGTSPDLEFYDTDAASGGNYGGTINMRDSVGQVAGRLGYLNTTYMILENNIAGGNLRLAAKGGVNSDIQFFTSSGSLERMRITGDGFVGIGTTTPVETLEVAGGIKFASSSLACSSVADEGAMQFGSGGSKLFEVCANSATGWQQLSLGGAVGGALGDLSDVTVASLVDGQFLSYNSATGNWVNASIGASIWSDSGAGYIEYNSGYGGMRVANITGAAAPVGATRNVVLSPSTVTAAGNNRELQFNSGGSLSATSTLVFTSAGRLGIGLGTPGAILDVAGEIKFASSSLACSTTADEGSMQYGSGGSKIFEVCADSTNGWEQLALGGTVAGAFTDLSDTPAAYTGQAGRFAVVNTGETAISFTDTVIESVTGQPSPNRMNLTDLGDVSTSGVLDQQVLNYDSASGTWLPTTISLGSGSVSAAGADTQIQLNSGGSFYASSGFVYDYTNGRVGVGTSTPSAEVDVVGDVKISNNLILSPISGLSAPTYISSGSYSLNSLTDVDTTGFADGNVLLYSAGAGGWVPGTASGGGGGALNDLSDATTNYTSGGMYLGQNAGASLTTGHQNFLAGPSAGTALTSGYDNVAVGYNTLSSATISSGSIAIGSNAASSYAEASEWGNVIAIGNNAASGLLGGFNNIAIGGDALLSGAGGSNVAIGVSAGNGGVGDYNLILGHGVANTMTGGSYNILLGVNTNASSATASNELNIGNSIYANGLYGTANVGINNASPSYALDVTGDIKLSSSLIFTPVSGLSAPIYASAGSVGTLGGLSDVDTTGFADGNVLLYSAGAGAWVPGTASGGGGSSLWTDSGSGYIEYSSTYGGMKVASITGASLPTSGAVGASSGGGSSLWTAGTGDDIYYNATTPQVGIGTTSPNVALDVIGDIEYTGTITDVSDMRLKTDITPLDTDEIIRKIGMIDTYSFRMKDDPKGRIEFGVMAQELEKVFPELVKTANDEMGTKSVNYVGMIAPLIEASKELKSENDDLRAQIAEMKTSQAQFQKDIMQEVNGLKAYTGYGISKAQIGLWTIALMFGFSSVFFMVGGILRHRQRKQE